MQRRQRSEKILLQLMHAEICLWLTFLSCHARNFESGVLRDTDLLLDIAVYIKSPPKHPRALIMAPSINDTPSSGS